MDKTRSFEAFTVIDEDNYEYKEDYEEACEESYEDAENEDPCEEAADDETDDPELCAIQNKVEMNSAPTAFESTLNRYGIAVVEADKPLDQTIACIVLTCKADISLTTTSEAHSYTTYSTAVDVAVANPTTSVLVAILPCDRVWERVMRGWPINLKIAMVAVDEGSAGTFEKRLNNKI